ncbi:cold shock domain-containing protein C2 isoform X1 [Leopardus geoffroyi]|uniref:cold shock domain-containing protein C2 isoform X1 n=1 Tax=Leopardus geoffroyi TaxID=46844 RepID=UPI001E260E44|nr:cold shock domain-containing protein C2 isoform X1 [Leopardus geoffroyi]
MPSHRWTVDTAAPQLLPPARQTEPVAGAAAEQGQAGPCPQGRPSSSPAPEPGSPPGSLAGSAMTSEPTSPPVVPPLHSPKSPVWPTFPFHREGSRVWERGGVSSRDLPSPLPTKRTRTYSAVGGEDPASDIREGQPVPRLAQCSRVSVSSSHAHRAMASSHPRMDPRTSLCTYLTSRESTCQWKATK